MDQFETIYWGDVASTEVRFEVTDAHPPLEQTTACMVAALHNDTLVMSRPARGWGLVGGHLEEGETAEKCVRRESMEEAAVELGQLRLVGYWKTKKVFESPANAPYPPVGYQLLYISDVTKVHDFVPQLEVLERAFVPFADVLKYHHKVSDFEEVFLYLAGRLGYEIAHEGQRQ